MGIQAYVKAIEELETLETELKRYRSEARVALKSAEAILNKTRAWLQERLAHWQQELKRRQKALEKAQQELKACLASRRTSCSDLQAAVVLAKKQVKEAEDELRAVQEQRGKVEEAGASYLQKACQLTSTLDNELFKCTALLSRSRRILNQYATSAPSNPKGRKGDKLKGSDEIGTENRGRNRGNDFTDYVARKYRLRGDKVRQFHDEITGQNFSRNAIEQIARQISGEE